VEHQKLKGHHFAADRDADRTEWVDALTDAATLQSDADDTRFILLILFSLFRFVLLLLH